MAKCFKIIEPSGHTAREQGGWDVGALALERVRNSMEAYIGKD